MIEQLITHDNTLHEGDVALVFTKEGDVVIRHNIAAVRETNSITGAQDGSGFLLAIAAAMAIGNDFLATRLMSEAGSKLEELTFPEVTTRLQ